MAFAAKATRWKWCCTRVHTRTHEQIRVACGQAEVFKLAELTERVAPEGLTGTQIDKAVTAHLKRGGCWVH
jgi:hypothetical protein